MASSSKPAGLGEERVDPLGGEPLEVVAAQRVARSVGRQLVLQRRDLGVVDEPLDHDAAVGPTRPPPRRRWPRPRSSRTRSPTARDGTLQVPRDRAWVGRTHGSHRHHHRHRRRPDRRVRGVFAKRRSARRQEEARYRATETRDLAEVSRIDADLEAAEAESGPPVPSASACRRAAAPRRRAPAPRGRRPPRPGRRDRPRRRRATDTTIDEPMSTSGAPPGAPDPDRAGSSAWPVASAMLPGRDTALVPLFDFDGTLVDSDVALTAPGTRSGSIRTSCRSGCRSSRRATGGVTVEAYLEHYDPSAAQPVRRASTTCWTARPVGAWRPTRSAPRAGGAERLGWTPDVALFSDDFGGARRSSARSWRRWA